MEKVGQNKNLIFIPYANLENANTGVNIRHQESRLKTYLMNCCVALISAKIYNSTDDVALVTNIDVPNPYKELLQKNNVMIIYAPYNDFFFCNEYKWSLAFYKLCALKYVLENYMYENYMYLDSDVYVQKSVINIWKECANNILLYDVVVGLEHKEYNEFCQETEKILRDKVMITHYGGELFAANRENALIFMSRCEDIFNVMKRNEIVTTFGDEYILSIAAYFEKNLVKNAAPYIQRYWTGRMRIVPINYKFEPVCILHVPAEKEIGMVKIYRKFFSKGKIPTHKQVYKYFHFKRMSFILKIKEVVSRILRRR